MPSNGFFERLLKSRDRVILGLDFIAAFLSVLFIYGFLGEAVIEYNVSGLVSGGTSFAAAMVAVILTGISILITMADSRAAKVLKGSNSYTSFLFTFEFTAILALVTAVLGIATQAFEYPLGLIYVFLFSLIYTVAAVTTTISRIITYGDKLAEIEMIEDVPDDISVRVVDGESEETSEKKS